MLYSKKYLKQVLMLAALLMFLSLFFSNTSYCASSNDLTAIRCSMTKEGDLPVKIRMVLDFKIKSEKFVLQKSSQPNKNFPPEYIEDFIAVTKDKTASNIIKPVSVKYGSAKDILNIKVIDNQIHIAILKEYRLNESQFKYVEATKVTYIDLGISKRTGIPEAKAYSQQATTPSKASKPSFSGDTVFVEKIVHDTIFVEKIVERIVEKQTFIEKGKTNLSGIKCVHYMPWWEEPYFKLSILFKKNIESLKLEKSDKKPDDTPSGYNVQYVISQEGGNKLQVRDAQTGNAVPHALPALPAKLKTLEVAHGYLVSSCVRVARVKNSQGRWLHNTPYLTISVFQLSADPKTWKLIHQISLDGLCGGQGWSCEGDVLGVLRPPVANTGSDNYISSLSFVDLKTKKTIHTRGGVNGNPTVVHSYKDRVLWCNPNIPPKSGRSSSPGYLAIEDLKSKQKIKQLGSLFSYPESHGYGPYAVQLGQQGGRWVVKRVNLQDGSVTDIGFNAFNEGRGLCALGGYNNIFAVGQGRNGSGQCTIDSIQVYDMTTGAHLSTVKDINIGHNGGFRVCVSANQVMAIGNGTCAAYKFELPAASSNNNSSSSNSGR